MPKLIFPASKDELLVDVLIGLDGATTTALLAAGKPILAPIRACGAIDTGSNVTAVSAAILQRLGVPVLSQTSTQTVAGALGTRIFEVSVGITDFADPHAPEWAEPGLLVMELTTVLPSGLLIAIPCLGSEFVVRALYSRWRPAGGARFLRPNWTVTNPRSGEPANGINAWA